MKLMKIVLLLSMMLLLVACSNVTQPNPGNPAMNDIAAALNQGTSESQIASNTAKLQIPSDINNALLPRLSVVDSRQQTHNEKRFNITVNNVPAQSFFSGLIKGTKYNLLVSPKVTGTISLNLKNVTIDEALQAVHDNYGYEYKKSSYGYQILPSGLQTRIFAVNYLDISRKGESDMSVSAGQISSKIGPAGGTAASKPASSVSTSSSSQFWTELSSTLNTIISPTDGRKIVMNPDAGIVIVRAFPNEISEIAQYLDSLQSNMTRQVIIEAKILEVQLSSSYKAGIDWTVLGLHQGMSEDVAGTVTTLAEKIPGFSSIFSVDAHIGNSFSALINMISTQGNVQILSSPRIATLNNQKAVIKVGNDDFFITNVDSSTTTGTGAATTSQNVDLTPFFSGISLDVTPQISEDGHVILHIHPLISKVSQKDLNYTLNDKHQSLPLASSKVRETDSIVLTQNGQIIVIGGLMENTTEENTGATPFISKAPIVGSLFRRTQQDSGKLELVILLRAIVVGNNTWTNQIRQASLRMQNANRGFHAGDHPEIFGNMAEHFPKTKSDNFMK